MKSKRLMQLHLGLLPEGLVLKEDLYNHNGKVLLLREGNMLTKKRIGQIERFNRDNSMVMVYDETYLNALRTADMPEEERVDHIRKYVGYQNLQKSVDNLLNSRESVHLMKDEALDPLSQDISEHLTDLDPVMILSCINFPRPMDVELQCHSLNVAFLNGLFGGWLGLSREECKTLIKAGIVHDVGKTKIPAELINAPRKLTEAEFKTVKKHPVYSYELLKGKFSEEICLAARQHHEKLDGSGYPDGLKGNEISRVAKITAISDIYDAMVAKRSYKEPHLPFFVMDLFYQGKLGRLDPELLGLFLWKMRENYTGKQVVMSDGGRGFIRFIPHNDCDRPVVCTPDRVAQTDETWYCREVLN